MLPWLAGFLRGGHHRPLKGLAKPRKIRISLLLPYSNLQADAQVLELLLLALLV